MCPYRTTEDASLDARGGFNTLASTNRLRLADDILGSSFSVLAPTVTNYGFWGDYGFVGVSIGKDGLSGNFDVTDLQTAVPLTGNVATAFAAGNINGQNPCGSGEAIWDGIAEAVSTRIFERRSGTARILIPSLDNPRASINIRSGETLIDPAGGWTDRMITDGGFGTGMAGNDYLEGNFHGSGHEEAYGVFDTDAYTGAFGAIRAN